MNIFFNWKYLKLFNWLQGKIAAVSHTPHPVWPLWNFPVVWPFRVNSSIISRNNSVFNPEKYLTKNSCYRHFLLLQLYKYNEISKLYHTPYKNCSCIYNVKTGCLLLSSDDFQCIIKKFLSSLPAFLEKNPRKKSKNHEMVFWCEGARD